MRRKSIALLIFVCLLASIFSSQLTTFAAVFGPITVQINNGNNLTTSNTIYANFKVTNPNSSPLNLANLKLRYYYTIDTEKPQNFWCDYSELVDGSSHQNITAKVTGTFVKMNSSVSTADYYLEVGFSSDTTSIPAGGSIEVQTRIAKSDWSNYDQSNDYSYTSSATYVGWGKVTAYYSGSLVFGETTPYFTATITPTVVRFERSHIADIIVNLNPKGCVLKGIVGLRPGIDFTVSGKTVTISKEFLLTLTTGSYYRFTFDFGLSSNPVLEVYIEPNYYFLNAKIGTATGNKGGTVTLPITFEGVATSGNVGTCFFDIDFDDTLLEAVSVSPGAIIKNPDVNFSYLIKAGKISLMFLDITEGSELITKDGVFADIKFKMLGDHSKTVPVSFNTQAIFGDGNFSKILYITFKNGSITIDQ